MKGWRKCLLGDIITFQRGYDLPKSKMVPGKYPVIGSNGVIGFHNEYTTEAPSITIGRSGNTGNPFIVYGRSWSHNTTLYVKEFKGSDPIFIYYLLKHLNLGSFSGGSAVPTLNRNHIHTLEVFVPPLVEQIKIGRILRIIDDKIATNNAINQHLEQIAQSIFKSWFMDNVTDDWFYVNLGSVTTEIRTRVKEKELPVLSAVKTGNLVLSEDYFTKQVYSKDISKYIVVAPNNFAYNPARINIGSIGINDFDFTGCVSPVYVVFRTEPEYHHFFRFFIKSSNFQEEVRVRASGSVRQSLNYRDFALIEVIYPPIDVVRRFNSLYEPIHTMQRYLEEENTHLAAIRDALLPRLMSGELSAPALENIT